MKHESLGKFKSSNVEDAKYYPMTKELVVSFKGGVVYTYHSVHPETWDGLQKAESKGAFIHGSVASMHKGERRAE